MNYTTIEQSKHLVGLGLDPNTADMYYFLDPTPAGNIYHLTVKRVDIGIKNLPEFDKGDIPCWTTGQLLKLIPARLRNGFEISIRKYDDELYQLAYGSYETVDGDWKDATTTPEHDNMLGACYSMFIWLLEQKYI